MTVIAGTLTTRVLLAHGDAQPVEIGTINTALYATGNDTGLQLSTRRYRRDLAVAFLRMAWHTWTTGE